VPAYYTIDAGNRIVRTIFTGVVAHSDPANNNLKLSHDPAFEPTFSELIEFNDVSDIQVNSTDLLALLKLDPFSENSRRAFVVGSRNVIYGIVRMYEILRNETPCVRIFETADEALSWLTMDRCIAR